MTEIATAQVKACRFCGEEIKAVATICRFCNREQVAPKAEQLLYSGPASHQVGTIIFYGALCFLLIGIPLLLFYFISHGSKKFTVTTRKVTVESGVVSKKIDVLELFRVQDMRFASSWGFGQITLTSSDRTSPRLTLPIPGAQRVFVALQEAVPEARALAKVSISEHQ